MESQRGSSSVVTYHQYPHTMMNDTKQEVVWKSLEVDAPEIAPMKARSFRRVGGLLKAGAQLGIEFVRKLTSADIFEVIHDPRNVSRDLRMKLKAHQLRRA